MSSWITTDDAPGFSLENLPYGVFSTQNDPNPHIGVAIGNYVLDLNILAREKVFDGLDIVPNTLEQSTLNQYASLGRKSHRMLRSFLQEILSLNTSLGSILRDNFELRSKALISARDVHMHLPMAIGDYSDFFTSPFHAQNCTYIVRPNTQLPANFWRMPLGYHGRASSIVVSGTPISRPRGQFLVDGTPNFGPCQKLDFEVEFAAFIGEGNAMGRSIDVNEADNHIFGFVLLNDWSARDIQRAETGLMGPLNGKNFATSISPWVVPIDALEPYRTISNVKKTNALIPYLNEKREQSVYDIPISAFLRVGEREYAIGQCNTKNVTFSFAQILAHHTVGGCPMRPGDLIASGTLSGPTSSELGCFLELTRDGQKPFEAEPDSERVARSWLEDGDCIIFRTGKLGTGGGIQIGFGTCEGKILPVTS